MRLIKRIFFHLLVNGIGASILLPNRLRLLIFNLFGIKAKARQIRAGCYFETPRISIGPHTFINNDCHFDNWEHISIGANCYFAMDVLLITSTHNIGDQNQRAGLGKELPITIGDGVWMGARSVVLPGVKIGSGCVIAAGAVVSRDCEPNGLYAGIPAARIKELPVL